MFQRILVANDGSEGAAGHEVGTIVSFAEGNHFDLLVIGHKGHSKIWPFHMGSTASKIADHAKCTLLIVQ